jgi:diguanylate cyclase (GGDEF)-like protein/PAS domain S-box-containing protein
MLVVDDVRGQADDISLLAAMSAVIFLLVLARVSLLTRAIEQAYRAVTRTARRQRILTDVAVALVGAGDSDALARAAVTAAAELSGRSGVWAMYAVRADVDFAAVATTGAVPDDAREAVSGTAAPFAGWDASGFVIALASGPCHVVPIMLGDDLKAVLLVGGGATDGTDVAASLRLLGSQVGLAVQTAEATEARLRARNERKFRTLIQHSSDVVTVVDAQGVVRYQSASVEAMLGAGSDEHIGTSILGIVHPDDASRAANQFEMTVAAGHAASVRFECRVAHRDGHWCDIETVMTNLLDEPDVEGVVLNSRDVTVRRALERELTRQAFHDDLTGLANRALFVDRVGHALDRADRADTELAVVFFDLDDFKLVNNSLGHPAGDALLVEVANRVRTTTRPGDTIARFGGDEFAMLLEAGEMPETAVQIAERVIDALGAPFVLGDQEVTVRASVGIAIPEPGRQSSDDLIRDADVAMYMAKRKGKGRFELFRPSMHEEVRHRLEIAADLRRAIDLGEFELAYQPIVGVHDTAATGVEALVRWHHPRRGLVLPLDFIPIAESTGLIVPLGRWVMGEACRQAQRWRAERVVAEDFYISVNLSARQLQDPAIVDDVAGILEASGLAPGSLVLEITESTIMRDFDTACARLQTLKQLGVRLAVDDFGTGYSSLSYLASLPVDVVKIDKSFVDRIARDAEGRAMVRGVIDLSRALGLGTIAEGVEADDQLALLEDLGCDNVQGHLFARPAPAWALPELLQGLVAGREHDGVGARAVAVGG